MQDDANAPSPDDVRAMLAGFDQRERKIIGGLVTVMMRDATRVREHEWIAEQLTQVTLLAGGFDTDGDAAATVADVGAFLRARSADLLAAAFALFQRVSQDLSSRADEGFTFEDAVSQALGYFAPAQND